MKKRQFEVRDYANDPLEILATFEVPTNATPGQIAMAALDALGFGIYDSDEEGDDT